MYVYVDIYVPTCICTVISFALLFLTSLFFILMQLIDLLTCLDQLRPTAREYYYMPHWIQPCLSRTRGACRELGPDM